MSEYLPTPVNHLPKNYPLPAPGEHYRYAPIWARAFDIHHEAHHYDVYGSNGGLYKWSLTVLSDVPSYCDCYEIAYQQLKHIL